VIVVAGACSKAAPPATDLVRTATIKDIMDSMVDPSGDFLFESVVEIADERGITEKAPHTDEEWADVRRHALVLLEAPNLLVMDGRLVARPHERSKNPQVELEPEAIQKLVDGDRPSFIRRARRLQASAEMVMKAAEAKDKTALFQAIESVDKACETCHLRYWYPNDKRAQQAAKEQGLVD
jgi:cytochrome c556